MKYHLGLVFAVLFAVPALADDKDGFKPLFDGKTLNGWKVFPSGTGQWKVEDGVIVGSGPASHLFTDRDDFTDIHLKARVSINDGGNSGMYFRTAFKGGFPPGYEAQINSTHRDPVKTGSLYNFVPVKEILVKPDEWFDYEVIAKGKHIVIKVNGKTTVDFMDEKETYKKGHIAFQQHHNGSVVKIKSVSVKDLTEK
jgi:hypothetical protein